MRRTDRIHDTTRAERAAASVYIAHDDFMLLCGIAQRLSERYKPDWHERLWRDRGHAVVLLGCVMALFLLCGSWAASVVAAALWAVATVWLPKKLTGRDPGMPRWAHPSACLTSDEVNLVADMVPRLPGVRQRTFAEAQLPADNGERFYRIYSAACAWADGMSG